MMSDSSSQQSSEGATTAIATATATAAQSASSGSERTIPLVTSDEQRFDVPAKIAFYSKLIKTNFEDDTSEDDDSEFTLPNVNSATLAKIIEFLNKYDEKPMWELEKPLKSNNIRDLVQTWYADFVTVNSTHDEVYDMLEAAHYLDIPPLLDLTCAFVASLIKGRKVEEIRANFEIESDFTEEEEAWLREENKWALDDK